jgi:hypothetical protein
LSEFFQKKKIHREDRKCIFGDRWSKKIGMKFEFIYLSMTSLVLVQVGGQTTLKTIVSASALFAVHLKYFFPTENCTLCPQSPSTDSYE